jgi:NADH-quinone oxidoreductase subunit G
MLPRRNVDVNKSWLCDEGRLSFHELAAGQRVVRPMIKGRDGLQAPVTWDEAAGSIDSKLKRIAADSGPDSILGFASPSATNEALFLFKRYVEEQLGSTRFEFRLGSEDKYVTRKEDEILRHMDKHPNSMGALKLGLASEELKGVDGAIAAARVGRIKAGVIVYLKPLVSRAEDKAAEARLEELIASLEYSVLLASHRADWQADASVLLPVAAWSEEDGTYTNFEGRIQMADKAVTPGGDIRPVWEAFATLLYVSGVNQLWLTTDDVFASMTETVPAYRAITLDQTKLPGVLAGQ